MWLTDGAETAPQALENMSPIVKTAPSEPDTGLRPVREPIHRTKRSRR